MRDWKTIPIPSKMQLRPKDRRGYPIPYNVFMHGEEPVFSVNDHQKNWDCADNKLCTLCGCGLQDDAWMIGGPLSAFHPQGVFLDLPVHKDCGLYALQVCPYLAVPNYANLKDASKLGKEFGFIAETLTSQNTKVPFFVFCKVSNWTIIPDPFLIQTTRPYLELEYWWDAERITPERAVELYKADTEQHVTFIERIKD